MLEGQTNEVQRWLDGVRDRYGVIPVMLPPVDWNDDLTPWPAEPIFKKGKPFGGKAPACLGKLEKEIIPGGFLGPKQLAPRKDHTVYFKNCLIEGGIDFIFGGATAYFDNCEFRSVEPGFVFAPSTPEHVKEGFVARNCRFTRTENVADGSCHIARPWRNYAKVRIEDCFLDAHIAREGFHDWNKPEARETMEFTEIRSFGPGACPEGRPDYVKVFR